MKKNDLEESIESEIEQKVDDFKKRIDDKIGPEIEKEIETVIDREVKKRVDQVLEYRLNVTPEFRVEELKTPEGLIQSFKRGKNHLLYNIKECLMPGSVCRNIFAGTLLGYIFVVVLMLICPLNPAGFCLNTGPFGAGFYLLLTIFSIMLFQAFFSYFSKDRVLASVFSVLIDLPLLVLIFIFAIQFIAYIVIGLIIISYLINRARNR